VAVLSGGCFWGVQAVYQHTRGVISATSGYSGGEAETAHYEMVGPRRYGTRGERQGGFRSFAITYGRC